MRVLMLTPSFYPIKGGAETLIQNLLIELNQIGIPSDVMTFNMDKKWNPYCHTKTLKTKGATVHRISAINWFPMTHSNRITMGINLIPGRFRDKIRKYDLLHFHVGDLTFPFFSYLVKKPKIAHFHGPLASFKKCLPSRLLLKNIADFHIASSKEIEKELIEVGIPPKNIAYLPNAVDTNLFKPCEIKEENLALFVGRIVPEKGLHILLKSLNYLKTKIRVVMIGPPGWNNKYFKEIQNQIDYENRNSIHKIKYLGALEPASIVKWYQKASIFILPTFKESFSIAVLEAMSCGTPVVATRVGGLPEAIIDGKTGMLVPRNNPQELASSIQYLLDNETVRTCFGREGRKHILENHSYALYIKGLCQIYKEMIYT